MQITDLPPDESQNLLMRILASSESRHLEFKRVSRKMVSKALETICAFANSDGGSLVLGIGDVKDFEGNDRLFGIEENPEAVDDLQILLPNKYLPTIASITMRRLSCTLYNGHAAGTRGHLLVVSVPRSTKVHSLVGGGT